MEALKNFKFIKAATFAKEKTQLKIKKAIENLQLVRKGTAKTLPTRRLK